MSSDSKFHHKPFTMIGSFVFLLVGVLHAARIVYGAQIVIGSTIIPMWASYLGAVVGILLALMMWRENRR
jgi:hypothetical protein